jgi:hypothetical protein
MTYDEVSSRLYMVEGQTNGNTQNLDWQFYLPFGLGLAGACFRDGNLAMRYRKPKNLDRRTADYYLPIPGSTDYSFLLAMPIDHPQFKLSDDAEEGAVHPERCRQSIGVVTIGSNYPASRPRTALQRQAIPVPVQRVQPTAPASSHPPTPQYSGADAAQLHQPAVENS